MKPLMIAGIAVLVVLLAGAAFVGGQLLSGQGLPLPGLAGGPGLTLKEAGGSGNQTVQIQMQPAAELPQRASDAGGIFDHRKDNSIFIGTGDVSLMMQKDQSGVVSSSSSHDGPNVEVVVTAQTTIYRDVTMRQFDGPPPSGKLQQVVEPGVLDEVGENSGIQVWGNKTGDRIIADVLVYSPPPVMKVR